MDHKDRQIIRALQRNGRATNLELAAEVNLSPSPCLRRVRLLEESRIITGYRADVDAAAYGLSLLVYIRIRLEKHSKEIVARFESRVRALDEVLECHLMTGPVDYLLRVVVSDLKAYEEFIRDRLHLIEGIASIDSSFVYGTVKNTGVFPQVN